MTSHNRNAQLGKIHIAVKDLGLDDETYRAMLFMVARVRSSKDLDHAGRAKVLDHLKGLGWKPKNTAPDVAKVKQKLIAKIHALLADMQLTWAYAEGISNQMYKRQKLEWCKPAELRGVITALTKKQKAQHAN